MVNFVFENQFCTSLKIKFWHKKNLHTEIQHNVHTHCKSETVKNRHKCKCFLTGSIFCVITFDFLCLNSHAVKCTIMNHNTLRNACCATAIKNGSNIVTWYSLLFYND